MKKIEPLAIVGYIAAATILVTIASLITFWMTGHLAAILTATGAMCVFSTALLYGKRYMSKDEIDKADKWTKW